MKGKRWFLLCCRDGVEISKSDDGTQFRLSVVRGRVCLTEREYGALSRMFTSGQLPDPEGLIVLEPGE